jgi:hypothetical protein
MIAFCQLNKDRLQAILVWKLNRLFRNRVDSAVYKRHLRRLGINVISITEPMAESIDSDLLEAVVEAVDSRFSKSLSQDVMRGMRESARRGHYPLSVVALGYKRQVDDVAVDWLRRTIPMTDATCGDELVETVVREDAKGNRALVDGQGDQESVGANADPKWYAVYAAGWAHSCVALSPFSSLTYWDAGAWGGIGFGTGETKGARLAYVIHGGAKDAGFAREDYERITHPPVVATARAAQ